MSDVVALQAIARAQGYGDTDLDARLIRAATIGGARALGMDRAGYGTLAVGGPADLAVFDVDIEKQSPESVLVAYGAGRCSLTAAGGKVLYDTGQAHVPQALPT